MSTRCVNVGLAASLVASAFFRIARAGGDTVKIGMELSVTGPGADGGNYALAGAKIALDRVNKAGGVLGKQVELITEDDLTTNPGAVLAFSKLAVQPDTRGPGRLHEVSHDGFRIRRQTGQGGAQYVSHVVHFGARRITDLITASLKRPLPVHQRLSCI
jgi:hypothetical protein